MGGLILGIDKRCKLGRTWLYPEINTIAVEVEIVSEWHIVIGLYNKTGIQSLKPHIDKLIGHRPDRVILIGDWNARVGSLGDYQGDKRSTKGKKWIDTLRNHGLTLLNGNTEADCHIAGGL